MSKAPESRDSKSATLSYNFPLLCMTKLNEKAVLVAGGGGSTKSGIPNKIVRIGIENGNVLLEEGLIDTGINNVMNMAFDSKHSLLACGVDEHCQLYKVAYPDIDLFHRFQTCFAAKDSLQRRVKISGDDLVTVGTDDIIRIWPIKDLLQKGQKSNTIDTGMTEIHSLDVHLDFVLVADKATCKVFKIHTKESVLTLGATDQFLMKDCKFSPSGDIYTSEFIRTKSTRVTLYLKSTDEKLTCKWAQSATRTINWKKNHHSCMTVSDEYVGIGTAEGPVHILASNTLDTVQKLAKHNFFVSDMVFCRSKDGIGPTSVVTISGDCTVHITPIVPDATSKLVWLLLGVLLGAILLTIYTFVQ